GGHWAASLTETPLDFISPHQSRVLCGRSLKRSSGLIPIALDGSYSTAAHIHPRAQGSQYRDLRQPAISSPEYQSLRAAVENGGVRTMSILDNILGAVEPHSELNGEQHSSLVQTALQMFGNHAG